MNLREVEGRGVRGRLTPAAEQQQPTGLVCTAGLTYLCRKGISTCRTNTMWLLKNPLELMHVV